MENKNKYTIVIYENGKEINRADCRSLISGYIDSDYRCGTLIIGRQNDCVYASASLGGENYASIARWRVTYGIRLLYLNI